jgi:hypothetical protein
MADFPADFGPFGPPLLPLPSQPHCISCKRVEVTVSLLPGGDLRVLIRHWRWCPTRHNPLQKRRAERAVYDQLHDLGLPMAHYLLPRPRHRWVQKVAA